MSFHRSITSNQLCALLIASVAMLSLQHESRADVVTIKSGTFTMTYDGTVFGDTSSSNFGLSSADGDFMRYGRYWSAAETVVSSTLAPKQPQAFRPLPIRTGSGNPRQPNFRDNRAELDPLYPLIPTITEQLTVNGNGPVANSEGRNRLSTTLAFDTADVMGSMSGLVQTNGVSAWWFANDAIMDAGGAWVSWGDLSLRYDASRVGLGYSGWVIASQLGGKGDIFDTKNISLNASATGISLQGELWGSDGTSGDPENENFATWETYTLMSPNLKVGSFSFDGLSVVPEPSSMALLIAAVMGCSLRRRR